MAEDKKNETMKLLAAIDTETTGLNPYRSDRLLEIAVILFDMDGTIHRVFTSLVNPRRDVGPTNIHGIVSADIIGAPDFRGITPHLLDALRPAVAVVGHNLRFDLSFLRKELERVDIDLPHLNTFDTSHLAPGKLGECCQDYGVEYEGVAHTAEADAKATASLFLEIVKEDPCIVEDLHRLLPAELPIAAYAPEAPLPRQDARARQEAIPKYIDDLLAKTGEIDELGDASGAEADYLRLLHDVLEDRVVEDHEGDQLVDLAVNWGLSVDRVSALHQEYLHRLVKTACLDDKVTSQEQADILQVARLLGFPDFTYDDLEQTVEHVYSDPAQEGLDTDTSQFTGKTVCFTGMSICRKNGQFISRDRAAEIAGINGMAVLKTVTKMLDILVVADPNSQSGKASKARRYGTRIIHEPEFWRLLSIEID